MLLGIEGHDLPGSSCGPGPDYPDGHPNIHVAVQRRNKPGELWGLVRGDAPVAEWELECTATEQASGVDLKGPFPQGGPGATFVYLSWGVVDEAGVFTMFRRAKLWLDAVPAETIGAACTSGLLIGRLGLSDEAGWPLCASVRPPRIEWIAGSGG